MDNANRKAERRSLLPQKTTRSQPLATSQTSSQKSRSELAGGLSISHQSKSANGSIGSSTPSAHAGSPPADVTGTNGDAQKLKPRKQVGRMEAPANVGRILSTKDRGEHLAKLSFIQKATSDTHKDQLAAPSRIATPRPIIVDSPSPEVVKAERLVVPRAIPAPKKSVIDAPDHRIAQEPEQRRAAATRPSVATSRHSRTNSQQPSSRRPSESRPASSDTAAKPAASRTERPAFSTLQQHFTPRKASKASTSSFLVQPSSKPATDDTLSPDSLHLQTQLAQLHLLHRSSATTQSQWEASAKTHFKRELQSISQQETDLQRLERDHHAATNYPALAAWSQSASNADFAERIQILSLNLHEISSLLEGGSQYERVIRTFETWFTDAQRTRSLRCAGEAELDFVEAMGDGWKADVAYWERKLMASARELQTLGVPREGSRVARVVALLRGAVEGMVEELGVVKAVERDVVVAEARWVEGEVAKIAWDGGDDAAVDSVISHGVWHEKGWG